MKKKLLSVILAVSMIATLMMGCGDTKQETTSTGEVAEEVTETAAKQMTAVEDLNNAAGSLNKNAGALSQAIDLFKV